MVGLTSRRSQPPLALAVPLSRFTPRVGGGSAFFVSFKNMISRVYCLITYFVMIMCYGLIAWAEHRFQISEIIEANRPGFIGPDGSTAVMLLPVNLCCIRNFSSGAIYYCAFMVFTAAFSIFFRFFRRTDFLIVTISITTVYLTFYGVMSAVTLVGRMKNAANKTMELTVHRAAVSGEARDD